MVDEVKHCSDGKQVIESYFKEVGDDWIESPEEFMKIFLDSLERLTDKRKKYKHQDGLLQTYCVALKKKLSNWKGIYSCKTLAMKLKSNEKIYIYSQDQRC